VEHAVTRGDSALIQIEDLPADLQGGEVVLHPAMPNSRERALPSLAESEAALIRETLRRFDGNKVRTAQSLGISRNKLYDRLRKLGLS
jgi:DNA-binding NtrC family response regulator